MSGIIRKAYEKAMLNKKEKYYIKIKSRTHD